MTREYVEFHKKIPLRYEYDVVVIGGGMAGVSAACAAADQGAKTLLIERYSYLGGNGTVGGVSGFCGESWGQGVIFDEIVEMLEEFDSIAPHYYQKDVFMKARWYDPTILAIVLQEITLQHNVKLLLHTIFVDTIVDPSHKKIDSIIVWTKGGLVAIKGKIFIDASGEADVVAAYGGEFLSDGKSGLKLPMSINFFVRKGSPLKKRSIPTSFFKKINIPQYEKEEDLPMISFGKHGRNGKSVKVKIPKYDATDAEQLSEAEIDAHRTIIQVLDYYKRKKHKNWELDYFAPQIGIREGRRIRGEYILTVEDVRKGKTFHDAIAVGTFPLDAHNPEDNKRTYILPKSELKVPPYQIPLRSLIPKDSENILVAGRILSADQLAMSSARVMTTCSMMGEAAGTVAGYCCKYSLSPQDITKDTKRMKTIQDILVKRGMWLDPSKYL